MGTSFTRPSVLSCSTTASTLSCFMPSSRNPKPSRHRQNRTTEYILPADLRISSKSCIIFREAFEQITPGYWRPTCTYTIPAGVIDLCHICFKPKPHQLSDLERIDFLELEAQNRADIRAGLDECCVGRGPQSPPLDFVPKYTRIVVEHTHVQPELTLFLNSQARLTIHHPERSHTS